MLFCVDVYVRLHLSWCVCTTLYVWRPEVRITSLFPPVFGLQCSTSGLQVWQMPSAAEPSQLLSYLLRRRETKPPLPINRK